MWSIGEEDERASSATVEADEEEGALSKASNAKANCGAGGGCINARRLCCRCLLNFFNIAANIMVVVICTIMNVIKKVRRSKCWKKKQNDKDAVVAIKPQR